MQVIVMVLEMVNILLEDGSNDGETSFILKEGDETVETTGIEDTFGGTILLEMSTLDRINDTEFAGQTSDTVGGFFVQDENEKLLIDDFKKIAQLQNYYLMVQTQVEQMMVNNLQQKMLVIV